MPYNKKIWKNGDIITKEGLNNMESGILDAHNEIERLKNNTSTQASGVSIQDTANNFTSTNVEGALAELFQSVSNGKSLIASAITDKGVTTSNTATFQTMADNIRAISGGTQVITYTITNNLTNCSTSNNDSSINANSNYTATITANDGYDLGTITVTMAGEDISSTVVSGGVITIETVTGDIVITATATEQVESVATLAYNFDNDTPGNGYGTITISVEDEASAGTYTIKYADDNGELVNYDKICTLSPTVASEATYSSFHKDQLIPKYATKIIAIKNNTVITEFIIPEAKRFTSGNYGQHLYSFGAISDIHTGADTWDTDLQEAFTYLNEKESVVFTCASGDITNNGTQTQFENFKTVKDTYSPDTPFYATNGNHEWYSSSFSDDFWRTYIDNDRTCLFTQGNDVFIMFGNEGEGSDCFTDENKTWLETQLARYANCRVFVFNHYFINGTDNGNFNNYYGLNVLTTSNTQGKWMLGLLQQYPNMFYVTGHSHMKFIVQELCNTITIRNDWAGSETGYMVHLPSITNPRDVINGAITSKLTAQSEGVVIDVYENCVLYRGRNFVDKKFIPIGQYLLPKAQGTLPSEVYCTGVTLDQTTLALDGTTNSATLTATVTPEDCTDKLLWSSNAIEIATVNNGIVTAVSDGVAIITATCGSYSAECNVTVTNMIVDDGTINITYNNGVKIDRSTGAESSSSLYYASDYIPYESGKEYELSINSDSRTTGNYVYICYYDTDKTFISCTDNYVGYANLGYLASSVLTIPEGTGYIRLRGSIGSGDYATSQAQITLTATAQ